MQREMNPMKAFRAHVGVMAVGVILAIQLAAAAAPQSAGEFLAWGTTTEASAPPPNLPSLVELSFGYAHAVGRTSAGAVHAWGSNSAGQCTIPAEVSAAIQVQANENYSGALLPSGRIVCWGGNVFGAHVVPTSLVDAIAFDLGEYHAMAIRNNGTVVAWGRQDYGATAVPSDLGVVERIAAASDISYAIQSSSGLVRAWGYSFQGSLNPPTMPRATRIAAGSFHGLALCIDGGVRGWGYNGTGPANVPSFTGIVVDIAAAGGKSMILLDTGSVIVFGDNTVGPPSDLFVVDIEGCGSNTGGLIRYDCDDNGEPDTEEIAAAPWLDCNDNEVLDVCQDTATPNVPIKWTAVNGGNFQDLSSWCFLAPTNTSSISFPYSPIYNVYFSQNRTVRNAEVSGGFPNFNLGGKTLTLSNGAQPVQAYLRVGTVASPPGAAPASLGVLNGTVSAAFTEVGYAAGSAGGLFVGPAGIAISTQELCVGCNSPGTLSVQDGGRVVTQKGIIGKTVPGPGTVLVEGDPGDPNATPPIPPRESKWESTLGVDVRNGTLTVGQLGVIDSPAIGVVLFSGGILEGSGRINGTVTNFGAAAGNCGGAAYTGAPPAHRRGGLVPGGGSDGSAAAQGGATIGTLTVNGVYQQIASNPLLGTNSGSLLVEVVPGKDGPQHDQLVVNGTASFGGGLFVEFPNGDPGDFASLPVVTATNVDANRPMFDVAVMPGLPDGRFVKVDPLTALQGGSGITISMSNLDALLGFGDSNDTSLSLEPLAAAVADFDGKNGPDLAVTVAGATPGSNGSLFVLFNDGTGGLAGTLQLPGGLGVDPVDIVAAPLQGVPGIIDLAVVNRGNDTLQILTNHLGTGDFGTEAPLVLQLDAGSDPVAIASAPFFEDKEQAGPEHDLVIAFSGSNQVGVYRIASGFPLPGPIILPTPIRPSDVDGVDVDNDRIFDTILLTSRSSSSVAAYTLDPGTPKEGDEVFGDGIEFLVGEDPVSMDVADLDGDGLLDVTTVNELSNSVSVLVNRTTKGGSINFAPAVSLPTGGAPVSVVTGDFDFDTLPGEPADLDIAFTARATTAEGSPRVVKILRNDRQNGVLVFAPADDQVVTGSPRIVLAAEMDPEPGVDLVTVATEGGGTQFGPSPGTASVRPALRAKKPCNPGDVNCDGVVDASDLSALLSAWGTADAAADLNDDGVVDAGDLAVLLSNWGLPA